MGARTGDKAGEGGERESDLLTSKSCTTGTSREGDMQQPNTGRQKLPPPKPRHSPPPTSAGSRAQEVQCLEGHACQRLRGAGEKQSLGLSRALEQWRRPPGQLCAPGKPSPDRSTSKAGKFRLLGSNVLPAGHAGTHRTGLGRMLSNATSQSGVPNQLHYLTGPNFTQSSSPTHCSETQLVSYLGNLTGWMWKLSRKVLSRDRTDSGSSQA